MDGWMDNMHTFMLYTFAHLSEEKLVMLKLHVA